MWTRKFDNINDVNEHQIINNSKRVRDNKDKKTWYDKNKINSQKFKNQKKIMSENLSKKQIIFVIHNAHETTRKKLEEIKTITAHQSLKRLDEFWNIFVKL